VEALKAELLDGESQLKYLQEKLEDLNLQKLEATTAINEGRRIMDIEKNSTTAEIFKLKGKFAAFHFVLLTNLDRTIS
jgi:kinetochore protein Spc7/SPC105